MPCWMSAICCPALAGMSICGYGPIAVRSSPKKAIAGDNKGANAAYRRHNQAGIMHV